MATPEVQDIFDEVTTVVTQTVQVGLTLKEYSMSAADSVRPGVSAFVFAQLNDDKVFVPGHEKLKRFVDEPTCANPLLAKLGSLFQALVSTSLLNTNDPNVGAFAALLQQQFGIDITGEGRTLTEAVKLAYPVFDALIAAQQAAMPATPNPFAPVPVQNDAQEAPQTSEE